MHHVIRTGYRFLFTILITGIAALLALAPALGQQSAGPVLIYERGQLSTWAGPEQGVVAAPIDGRQPQRLPQLSPDGTRAVYNASTGVFVDWLATVQGAGGFLPPEDIYIFDLPSQRNYLVAGHPDDATYNGPNGAGSYILRSGPAWSPAGDQLAWLELYVEAAARDDDSPVDGAGQLVIYDLVDRSTRTVEGFALNAEFANTARFAFAALTWGEPGIVVRLGSNSGDDILQVYSPSGERVLEASVNFGGLTWIEDDGQMYLFRRNALGALFDPRTGEVIDMPGQPEMYSRTAPDGASFVATDGGWTLNLSGGTVLQLDDDVRPYGIARDGQQAVYGRQTTDPETGFFARQVYVQSSDQLLDIGLFADNVGVTWGPVGWRVRR